MHFKNNTICGFIGFILLVLPISFAAADTNSSNVMMQLQAEDWVTTQSADVTVMIDAALDKAGAIEMRNQINTKLSSLVNVPWHITYFDTSKNAAGLDELHVEATARVPENFITGLHDKAKDLSKPGITFGVSRIDFTPSLAEFENMRGMLRAKLYIAAKDEVARINKAYPEQKYHLQSISFQDSSVMPPMPYATNMVKAAGIPRAALAVAKGTVADNASAVLAVSTKIQMTATVTLSPEAEPSPEEKKIEKLETSMLHDPSWKN